MRALLAACLTVLVLFTTAANAADPTPYGRLPAVNNMRLSPSGHRYAFIGMVNDKRMLVAVDADTNKAIFATGVGDLKVRSIRWASEDHILVMVTNTENLMVDFGAVMELATVLRVNLKDKSFARIFDGNPSIAQRVFGMFGTANVGGKTYGYFGGITMTAATGNRAAYVLSSGTVDLYKVDLDTGRAWLEAHGQRQWSTHWHVAPDGTVAATALYQEKSGAWRLHAGEGHNKALMEKVSPLDRLSLLGFGRTPGTLLVLDTSTEEHHLFEVNATDGSKEELYKDVGVEELLHDPVSGLLVGARTTGRESATFFDPALEQRWASMLKTFPGRRISLAAVSRNLDRVILSSEGGKDSGTYWLAEPATGKTTPLGNSYPAIRPPQMGETSLVQYKAEDGLDLEGVLTLPPSGARKNLPLVMLPHGGPIGVHDEIGFDWWAQAFAAQGYAVFQPNYRGSSGYSVAFQEAGYGEWGKKMLSDIKDGIAALAAKGIIDPKRACIVGGSYGGYAAMAGITLQQGLYKCAVAVAGVSDVRLFASWRNDRYGRDNSSFRFYRVALGIDKNGNGVMDEISPIRFAKRADAPLLLIHGKDDLVVPIAQSGAMESELKGFNKPVEFVRMEGEDHWLSHESTRITMIKAAVDFVVKHNPPDAAAATAN